MKIETYLKASPIFAVQNCHQKIVNTLSPKLKEEGVNYLEALILISIFFDNAIKVHPKELAKVFCTSKSNISHAITSLESKGLIKRHLSTEDARSFYLALRPLGSERTARLISLFDHIQISLEKQMGIPTLQQTLNFISQLEGNFSS